MGTQPVGADGAMIASPGPGGRQEAAATAPLQVSAARVAAAAAVRRLGHTLVAHDADEADLRELAEVADRLRHRMESTPRRQRPIGDMKRAQFAGPPRSGEPLDHFPDCVVSGKANPLGIAIEVVREGDEAVARVTLGAAFEGAPGRAHGGTVAAVFDDTLGYVLLMEQTPAYTGELTVTYRAPTPIGEPLEFRARLASREGRKLRIVGHARHGDTVVAEAKGLFIAVDPEHFRRGRSAG